MRRADRVSDVRGHDPRHGVDGLGPGQLAGDAGEAREALGDPAGQAGTVARGVLRSPILTGHLRSCLSLAAIGPGRPVECGGYPPARAASTAVATRSPDT